MSSISAKEMQKMNTMIESPLYNSNIYDGLIVKLKWKKQDGNIAISISFMNTSDNSIKLPYWFLLEDELTNNYFYIQDEDGNKIKYLGKMIKRKEPQESDFRLLLPKTTLEKNIVISNYYDILSANKKIYVKYFVPLKISSEIIEIDIKH